MRDSITVDAVQLQGSEAPLVEGATPASCTTRQTSSSTWQLWSYGLPPCAPTRARASV